MDSRMLGFSTLSRVASGPSLNALLLVGIHFSSFPKTTAWRTPDPVWEPPVTAPPPSALQWRLGLQPGWKGRSRRRLRFAPMLMFVVCEGGNAVRGRGHDVNGGLPSGLAARLPGKTATFLPNPRLDGGDIRGRVL